MGYHRETGQAVDYASSAAASSICCHNLVEDKPRGQEREGYSFLGCKNIWLYSLNLNDVLKKQHECCCCCSLLAACAHNWVVTRVCIKGQLSWDTHTQNVLSIEVTDRLCWYKLWNFSIIVMVLEGKNLFQLTGINWINCTHRGDTLAIKWNDKFPYFFFLLLSFQCVSMQS